MARLYPHKHGIPYVPVSKETVHMDRYLLDHTAVEVGLEYKVPSKTPFPDQLEVGAKGHMWSLLPCNAIPEIELIALYN